MWVAAVGKAASAMVLGAHDALGSAIEHTLLITKDGHVAPQRFGLPQHRNLESAHPVPDAAFARRWRAAAAMGG